ncbi:hypothetical protein EPUL_005224 [Erysiphe pulchra]|uniref:Uncharacterized protein n=1 Tax=Erysiphe pulchra TaxID=225359 RepID=A0A2S4PUY5_9PEZI|nr:hypothetical protein EPUL_005224 [Erysiphe pulchra]
MFDNRSRSRLPQDDIGIESLKPYQDNPLDEEDVKTPTGTDIPLPNYEPMHDYLRRQNARFMTTVESSTLSRPFPDNNYHPPSPYYTDEPFLINLDDTEAPPPSYDILHQQHDYELQSLRGFFMNGGVDAFIEEEDDQEDDTGLQFEDLVKWVIVMLMISLIVAFVGTLFDWGRSPQQT